MIQRVIYNPDGTIDFHLSCEYCGKPITTTGRSGMSCEDRCIDAWVRWDRLSRPAFMAHLERIGKDNEARAERDTLAARLFRPDGSPKHAGPPEIPPMTRRGSRRGER